MAEAGLSLEKRITALEERIARQETEAPSVVTLATLAPETLKLKKPIPVYLRSTGEDWIASFLDGNINASGETEPEALDNLKDILTATFRHLTSLPAEKLGPGPARQLAVLREFVESP